MLSFLRRHALFAAVLSLLTAAVYFPSLSGAFLAFDDEPYVAHNDALNPSAPNAAGAFISFTGGLYQPLPSLSFMAERAAFGLSAKASRSVNLLIHICVVMLVMALAAELGAPPYAACAAAFLFALHPMHAESVAWISERKDLLCAVFYFAALLVYVRSRGDKGIAGPVWLLAFGALLSKVSAVSLPFALFAVDISIFKKDWRRAAIEKLPLLGVCAGFAALNIYAHDSFGSFGIHSQKWWEGLFVGARNMLFYPARLLWPAGLSPFYPYPAKAAGLLPAWYYAAPLVAGGLAWAVWRFRAALGGTVLCGILLYCAMVLPMLQIIPAGSAVAADHFSYLPSFGIFLAVAALLVRLAEYVKSLEFRALYPALLSAFLLAGAGLGLMCWERARVWRSDIQLWSDVLSRYPRSVFALHNRAAAFVAAGRYDLAMEDYSGLLEMEPLSAVHHNDFGVAASLSGNNELALAAYARAIELKPDYAMAYNNRGFVLGLKGETAKAKSDFEKALTLDPGLVQARKNLDRLDTGS